MQDDHPLRVPADQLTVRLDPRTLGFETTAELEPIDEVIGQDRALKALRLGLEIESRGFNVFVAGFAGSGRTTTIKKVLEEFAVERPAPDDLCYVNNFQDPIRPRMLRLAPGQGRKLARAMDQIIRRLEIAIPQVLESEELNGKIRASKSEYEEATNRLFHEFGRKAEQAGFALQTVSVGPVTQTRLLPVRDGEAIPLEKILYEDGANPAEVDAVRRAHDRLSPELEAVFKESKRLTRELHEQVQAHRRNTLEPLLNQEMDTAVHEFQAPGCGDYFQEVRAALLEGLEEPEPQAQGSGETSSDDVWRPFRVNVLVDNTGLIQTPVVVENSPTHKNLFGTIERAAMREADPPPDFLDIRPGSVLRAGGGYLVINAHDVLTEPGVWNTLKRVLRTGAVEVQSYETVYPLQHSALKPEPVALDTRVIMVGEVQLYQYLFDEDEDLRKIFKIKAEFDSVIERTPDNIGRFARFATKVVRQEKLPAFDRGAVAAVVDHASRIAENQAKLSTTFSVLSDVIIESGYWARKSGAPIVAKEHVEIALRERRYRSDLLEQRIQELIREQTILIDVRGLAVGQVNGLTVMDTGDHVFAKPVRITAATAVGKAGIINIEREVELSGSTHDKGILILHAYLRSMYAQVNPLTLSASICLEQSYHGIDGDSASSAELYALLSSIGEFPLRQDIAVTGSINQKGDIQPIGGVNEKIEGFFLTCRATGLTGEQGVIIPAANLRNLVLEDEVCEAVREGLFHVYAVRNIEEGISILSGLEPGTLDDQGYYPRGTVHELVLDRLYELSERHREYDASDEPEQAGEE